MRGHHLERSLSPRPCVCVCVCVLVCRHTPDSSTRGATKLASRTCSSAARRCVRPTIEDGPHMPTTRTHTSRSPSPLPQHPLQGRDGGPLVWVISTFPAGDWPEWLLVAGPCGGARGARSSSEELSVGRSPVELTPPCLGTHKRVRAGDRRGGEDDTLCVGLVSEHRG